MLDKWKTLTGIRSSEIGDALTGVNEALESAWEVENTAERGRLLGTLYSLMLKVLEVGAIEERISALEEITITR